MKKNTFTLLTLIVGFIAGVSAISVFAYTDAPLNPPNDNTYAPINVSRFTQDKEGPLRVNTEIPGSAYGLDVFGIARFWNGFVIETRAANPTTNLDTGRMWLIVP